MPDIVDAATRSRMMAGIRSKNTKPEILLRKALHRKGFRYVLHSRKLPGKPDIVFPARKAVIFVHGCFWHGHDCSQFHWPKTRPKFWRLKLTRNRNRDARAKHLLGEGGWRVATVHECSLRGSSQLGIDRVSAQCATWLAGKRQCFDVTECRKGASRK